MECTLTCLRRVAQYFEKKATNNQPGLEKIDHLEGQVSEVTHLLHDNVEKILDRGERLDRLQDRTDDLEVSSQQFRKQATRLKRNMCCQNARSTCILITVIVVIIGAIVLTVLLVLHPWDNGSGHKNGTLTAGGHTLKASAP